jgi:hypothetical protein
MTQRKKKAAAVDLVALRTRIDHLSADPPARLRLLDRLPGKRKRPACDALVALSRELDLAGVHTLADAKLLARLMESGQRRELGKGFSSRAKKAAKELKALLSFEERAKRIERKVVASAVFRAEQHLTRLIRIVRVAEVLAAPDEEPKDPFALLPSPEEPRPAPGPPTVEAAARFAQRAAATPLDFHQKRRDLDAAHELLLRLSSFGTGSERDRVRLLRAEVSRARAELPPEEPRRKGSSSRVRGDPVRGVLDAWKRGDASAAYARLSGLYLEGVRARDPGVAGAARRALHAFEGKVKRGITDAVARDPLRCFLAQVGDGALAAEAARLCGTLPGQLEGRVEDETTEALAALAFDLDSEKWAVFDLAVGTSRFFDVEGATSEDVEVAPAKARAGKLLRTPYPTENMVVEVARGVDEVRDFLITDPRLLKYDVAAGRQLVRAYVAEAPPEKPKKVRRTAVRVYLCDASGSMRGPRARFRDAILIAELNNLSVKAKSGSVDPLYFTFFNDFVGPLNRVATAGEAVREVRTLFEKSPASGGTALTSALVTAFESIREARGSDPYLARATVVLITDGEAEIGLEKIRVAKAPVGGLEVVLSFISLGEENPHLKALVLAQQEEGQRAFYCHLSDEELAGARSDFDSGPRLLLPRRAEVEVNPKDPEIQEALAALEAIGKRRPRSSAAAPGLRFEGIFSLASARRGASGQPEPHARLVALVGDLLEAVCEAAALCPAERRAGEAVALLEHLLSVYDISVPRYLAAMAQLREPGLKALQRIRLLAGPGAKHEDVRAVRTGR